MEYDDEDALDAPTPLPVSERPKFPYGLRICLTSSELRKIDEDLDPRDAIVGGTIHLFGMARITSVSSSQDEGGKDCCRIEMQIEDLGIESEDAENEESEEED